MGLALIQGVQWLGLVVQKLELVQNKAIYIGKTTKGGTISPKQR